jgi:heat shock protein HslJ
MNISKAALGWVFGIMAAAMLLSGCASPGKYIVTTSIAVDHAMQGWAVYVVDGHATINDELTVMAAHERYIATEDAVLEAWLAFQKSGDKLTWIEARDALLRYQLDLLMLVDQLTKEKP